MESKDEFSIGEAGRILKASPDLIRYYESRGVFTARRVLGQRVLSQADIKAIADHRRRYQKARAKK